MDFDASIIAGPIESGYASMRAGISHSHLARVHFHGANQTMRFGSGGSWSILRLYQ